MGQLCDITIVSRQRRAPRNAVAPDCRHYRGDRPCEQNALCTGCAHYAPHRNRLCVIKLGALGDVIRTLCILPALRERYPDAHVTWVSSPAGCRMIGNHPLIDRVLAFDAMNAMVLQQERFDLVVSLDKEPAPCALAVTLWAQDRVGVGLSAFGTPVPLNAAAEAYFNLGLCDELKFHRNRKSYPALIHEAIGLPYDGQRYELPVDPASIERVRGRLIDAGWRADRPTLGINVGAGATFANKMWPWRKTVDLIRALRADHDELQIALLGGPDEREATSLIKDEASIRAMGPNVIDTGTDHDERSFVALVDHCDTLFSGDTMAMHVAIARGVPVVALFGPTCEQEIDLFGRGEKLVARVPCGPCYKRHCDQSDACVGAVSVEEARDAIERTLPRCRPALVGAGESRRTHDAVRQAA
jgi:heptosyltransferase-2